MEIEGESLDAVLWKLYRALPKSTLRNAGTRGPTIEILGVALRILRPRARISRSENRGKPFSALGELLWYLSGDDKLEFIQRYVPDYKKEAENGIIHGAYGPRLFAMRDGIDQFANVDRLLREKPGSRRAVIQLFNAEDITKHFKEIPCTTTLQFHLRDGVLHLSVTLRSNDAYFGLPHDVFCFTMIQEMMARRLGVELGEYYQYVGSMHVYEDRLADMAEYVEEGVQRALPMPEMPEGNPFDHIGWLLDVERRVRANEPLDASKEAPDAYWADIVRLLQTYWAKGDVARLDELKDQFAHKMYRPYVDGRRSLKPRNAEDAVSAKA